MPENTTPPRAFISYCWTSIRQEALVLRVAEKLRSDGVDVILDKWDLKEGHDKYVFMEQMVTDPTIEKVLIFSDARYSEKADKREGGVGTESQIISEEVYHKVKQEKFIPIATEKDADGRPFMPTYLKSRMYIDFSDEEGFYPEYEKLLRNLFNKPAHPKPGIGRPPSFLLETERPTTETFHKLSMFKDAIQSSKHSSRSLAQSYLETLAGTFEGFRCEPDRATFDEKVLDSIGRFKPYRDELIEFFDLLYANTDDMTYYDFIVEYFENLLAYYYPPEDMGSYSEEWFDNYKFIALESFLYLIALALKHRRFEIAKFFFEEGYHIKNRAADEVHSFVFVNRYLASLEEFRKGRLKLNRTSLTADLLKERADTKLLKFEDIMQADFVMSMRSVLHGKERWDLWFPRTLVYRSRWQKTPFAVFAKTSSPRHFETVKTLLGVESKDDLIAKLTKADEIFDFRSWRFDFEGIPIAAYLNLEGMRDS